ncbi:hypothetical protein [Nocardia sp. CA-135398]
MSEPGVVESWTATDPEVAAARARLIAEPAEIVSAAAELEAIGPESN